MRLLVTGGAGFLGAYFTRYAIEQGAERVVVLDRYADLGRIEDVLDRVTVIEGDVSDAEVVKAAIEDHNIDHVAHYAFILGSPPIGQMLRHVPVQSVGTTNVYEAARTAGVKRVVAASSVAAYGDQTASPLTEDLRCDPKSPYGFCKVWGEALGRYYTDELGLQVVTVRFGSTYGLGRAWRGSYNSGLLTPPPQAHYMARVEDAVRGEPIELPRGDALADWTYAADSAQATWLALTAPRPSYHLYNVSAERRPVGDFTRVLRKLLPDALITTSDAEPPGNAHAPMDNGRLVNDLGFNPKYSLEAGVRDYISRVRAYDAYWRRTPLNKSK